MPYAIFENTMAALDATLRPARVQSRRPYDNYGFVAPLAVWPNSTLRCSSVIGVE